jgi:uncharacterized protein (TIGR03034 family)
VPNDAQFIITSCDWRVTGSTNIHNIHNIPHEFCSHPNLWQTARSQKEQDSIGRTMATKNIEELTLDEFFRIQGPENGSLRDGSRVVVGRTGDRNSCVTLAEGKLQVAGPDEFRRTVETAYEAKQAPSSGFGYSPNPTPKPEPEPTLSRLMPKTDTSSATAIRVPILVYQSPRKPGLNADGTPANDMTFGDLNAEKIKSISTYMDTKMFDLRDPEQADPRYHFMNLRAIGGNLFSVGEMKMVVLAMIAKFEKSEGGEFRHPLLTQHVKADPRTQQFVATLLAGVNAHINSTKGNLNPESLANWMNEYPSLRPPVFGGLWNNFTGLTMAINDVWGASAELTEFDQFGSHYKGRVKFTLYDHFGLDTPDIGPDPDTGAVKKYGLLAGFRSWFLLQHYDRFAYKPFISVMEFFYPIEGDL